MAVTALEISVNGERLNVVGMEGWMSIGAHLHGVPCGDAGGGDRVFLNSSVTVPDPQNPMSRKGQQYDMHTLAVGDEVTIRIVETDKPDPPNAPSKGNPDWWLSGT